MIGDNPNPLLSINLIRRVKKNVNVLGLLDQPWIQRVGEQIC